MTLETVSKIDDSEARPILHMLIYLFSHLKCQRRHKEVICRHWLPQTEMINEYRQQHFHESIDAGLMYKQSVCFANARASTQHACETHET